MDVLLEALSPYARQVAMSSSEAVAGPADYRTEVKMYVAPGSVHGQVDFSSKSWCYIGSVWNMGEA
jgi:hypothetical protein